MVDLPDNIRADLSDVSQRITGIATAMTKIKAENDADALIGWRNINWKFSPNRHVDAYRKAASTVSHAPMQWRAWHAPQYFSNTPLPTSEGIMCKVTYPGAAAGAAKHTTLKFGGRDTTASVIAAACVKFHISTSDVGTYVFKANGLLDYMDGSAVLLSYEHVRLTVREGLPLVLALVKRPVDPATVAPAVESKDRVILTNEYKNKGDSVVEVKQPADEAATPGVPTTFPLSSLNRPFRIRINGLENCIPISLPRFNPAKMDKLSVKSM
jgi:hypothetical protein